MKEKSVLLYLVLKGTLKRKKSENVSLKSYSLQPHGL